MHRRQRHRNSGRSSLSRLIAFFVLPGLLMGMSAAAAGVEAAKVLVIGFDGMDPQLLAEYRAQGLMPACDRLLSGSGEVRELGTSIPPQSPVAWSNFSTGRDPGGHAIYDFIHRDPATMHPFLSTSHAQAPTKHWHIGDWKFPRNGSEVENLCKGEAFWQILDDAGVDVTVFKVPANFPPVECEGRSLSGMGTPDIQGTYGIFSYLTSDPTVAREADSGQVIHVWPENGHFTATLPGPINSYREGDPQAAVEMAVTVDQENRAAMFEIEGDRFVLQEGEWSDWVSLDFEMIRYFKGVAGICRFYLLEVEPYFRLYVTPIQIDPRDPEMPISTPEDYAREIAEDVDLFYTQGLPEDSKALEGDILSDVQYASQSEQILQERLRQFEYELDRFARRDDGFLFFYFNSPDQSTHMHWRNMDPGSPMHATADSTLQHRVRDLYVTLDDAIAMALDRCGDDSLIIFMSDHGFAPYHRSFHTNAWLLENGYLALRLGVDRSDVDYLFGIDWSRTRAYAIGINGIYLNQAGREVRGIVDPGAEREALLTELQSKLESLIDPGPQKLAIKYAYRADEVYSDLYRDLGPDIIVGYHRGWRGSNECALGAIPDVVFEDNLNKWSGDHCMAADEVPGIIMTNRPLTKTDPTLVDLAPTILRRFGLEPTAEMIGSDIFAAPGTTAEAGTTSHADNTGKTGDR